jgi:hypothetical protein
VSADNGSPLGSHNPTSFAIHLPDSQRRTVGFIGMLEADVLLGSGLAAEDSWIVEAERLFASRLAEASLPNLQVPLPTSSHRHWITKQVSLPARSRN